MRAGEVGARRRVLPVVLPTLTAMLAAMLAASGCVTELEVQADRATFRIQSTDEVRVITSTRFDMTSNRVELLTADTIFVSGGHEGTIRLEPSAQFYIKTSSRSEGNLVSMEVFVGEEQWYGRTRTLALEEFLEFIYGAPGSGGCGSC